MATIYLLELSNRKNKKYMVTNMTNNKRIHFGEKGMSDYTLHGDVERKMRYENRHQKREDWTNISTAGFWSKNLLWNLPSLIDSIKQTEREYNIIIRI